MSTETMMRAGHRFLILCIGMLALINMHCCVHRVHDYPRTIAEARGWDDAALERYSGEIHDCDFTSEDWYAAIANGTLIGISMDPTELSFKIRSCIPFPMHAYLFKIGTDVPIHVSSWCPGTIGREGLASLGVESASVDKSGDRHLVFDRNAWGVIRNEVDLENTLQFYVWNMVNPEIRKAHLGLYFDTAYSGPILFAGNFNNLSSPMDLRLCEVPGEVSVDKYLGKKFRRSLVAIRPIDINITGYVEVLYEDPNEVVPFWWQRMNPGSVKSKGH